MPSCFQALTRELFLSFVPRYELVCELNMHRCIFMGAAELAKCEGKRAALFLCLFYVLCLRGSVPMRRSDCSAWLARGHFSLLPVSTFFLLHGLPSRAFAAVSQSICVGHNSLCVCVCVCPFLSLSRAFASQGIPCVCLMLVDSVPAPLLLFVCCFAGMARSWPTRSGRTRGPSGTPPSLGRSSASRPRWRRRGRPHLPGATKRSRPVLNQRRRHDQHTSRSTLQLVVVVGGGGSGAGAEASTNDAKGHGSSSPAMREQKDGAGGDGRSAFR